MDLTFSSFGGIVVSMAAFPLENDTQFWNRLRWASQHETSGWRTQWNFTPGNMWNVDFVMICPFSTCKRIYMFQAVKMCFLAAWCDNASVFVLEHFSSKMCWQLRLDIHDGGGEGVAFFSFKDEDRHNIYRQGTAGSLPAM